MSDSVTLDEIKAYLRDHDLEDTVVLENPAFETAIIGISENNELIYDFELMVKYLSTSMTEDEAVDFICYNTIRAIPYMPGKRPIILHKIYLW